MELRILNTPLQQVEAEALVIPAPDKDAPRDSAALKQANEATAGWVEEVYGSGEFTGKFGELALLHRPAGFAARRLVLAGCGKPDKFDAAQARKLAGAVVRGLKARSVKSIAMEVEAQYAAAAAEGALVGDFEPDRYKTASRRRNRWRPFRWWAPSIKPRWIAAASWARRRTSPAISSTSRATGSRPPCWPTARARWPPRRDSTARFSTGTGCGSLAWARCWAWRRVRSSRPA
jgi:leucyl aminopeptidase